MVNPNVVDRKKNTPLLTAIENKNFLAFDLLLESCDVDINAENDKGETAIFLAIKYFYSPIFMSLYEIDIKPFDNQYNLFKSILYPKCDRKPFYAIDFNHLTKKNENALHYICLYNNGMVDLVDIFLQIEEIDPNLMSDEGTPLFYAFKSRQIEVIKLLLKNQKIRKDNITAVLFYFFVFLLLMENLR